MFSFSKKTEYALVALSYLAQRSNRMSPAREIAKAHQLPLSLLMNILKSLHQHGVIRSTRGTKGGYQICVDPDKVTLAQLIEIVDSPVHLTECSAFEHVPENRRCRVKPCPIRAPIRDLHDKFVRFLGDVSLSHLLGNGQRRPITPGREVGLKATPITEASR